MKTTVKGIIQEILPIENRQIQSGTFPSQQFIISEPDGNYKNTLVFNCWAEKCNLLHNLQVGTQVSVEYFIKSVYSKTRWYTNLYVINITRIKKDEDRNENEF